MLFRTAVYVTDLGLGYDTSCKYGFPIIGRNGVDLADKYTPYPKTYLGVAIDGFPNFFHVYGPNSGVGAGSLLLIIERQAEYVVQAVLKIQRERLKSMEVKAKAIDDFDQYLEVRIFNI
jgi:cation diffusion facilitator CzcD-associated flavoprotein CzcO